MSSYKEEAKTKNTTNVCNRISTVLQYYLWPCHFYMLQILCDMNVFLIDITHYSWIWKLRQPHVRSYAYVCHMTMTPQMQQRIASIKLVLICFSKARDLLLYHHYSRTSSRGWVRMETYVFLLFYCERTPISCKNWIRPQIAHFESKSFNLNFAMWFMLFNKWMQCKVLLKWGARCDVSPHASTAISHLKSLDIDNLLLYMHAKWVPNNKHRHAWAGKIASRISQWTSSHQCVCICNPYDTLIIIIITINSSSSSTTL